MQTKVREWRGEEEKTPLRRVTLFVVWFVGWLSTSPLEEKNNRAGWEPRPTLLHGE
jgi:hypothetical protein